MTAQKTKRARKLDPFRLFSPCRTSRLIDRDARGISDVRQQEIPLGQLKSVNLANTLNMLHKVAGRLPQFLANWFKFHAA